MYLVDNDGEESTVNGMQLRRMARNNGILDWQSTPIDELIETIMECYPDVTITAC